MWNQQCKLPKINLGSSSDNNPSFEKKFSIEGLGEYALKAPINHCGHGMYYGGYTPKTRPLYLQVPVPFYGNPQSVEMFNLNLGQKRKRENHFFQGEEPLYKRQKTGYGYHDGSALFPKSMIESQSFTKSTQTSMHFSQELSDLPRVEVFDAMSSETRIVPVPTITMERKFQNFDKIKKSRTQNNEKHHVSDDDEFIPDEDEDVEIEEFKEVFVAIPKKKKKKKKYDPPAIRKKFWSDKEVACLKSGMKEFGTDWQKIMNSFDFKERSLRSLQAKAEKSFPTLLEKIKKKKMKEMSGVNAPSIKKPHWTQDEIDYLKQGMRKYGKNWSRILDSYPFHNRTVRSLQAKAKRQTN